MFGNQALTKAVNGLTDELRELRVGQTNAILTRLQQMEKNIMAAIDQVREELGVINGVTTEIASDIDELIANSVKPGMTDAEAAEVVEALKGVSTTLKGVAAKYPAPPPPEA